MESIFSNSEILQAIITNADIEVVVNLYFVCVRIKNLLDNQHILDNLYKLNKLHGIKTFSDYVMNFDRYRISKASYNYNCADICLIRASKIGDHDLAKSFVDRGATFLTGPVHLAAENGNRTLINLLINAGLNIFKTNTEWSVFYAQMIYGYAESSNVDINDILATIEIYKSYIDDISVDFMVNLLYNEIIEYSRKAYNFGVVKYFSKLITMTKSVANKLIMSASKSNDIENVKWISTLGANINLILYGAGQNNNRDMIKLAIVNGITEYKNIMAGASRHGHIDLLKEYDTGIFGDRIFSIHCAIKGGHLDIAKYLYFKSLPQNEELGHKNEELKYYILQLAGAGNHKDIINWMRDLIVNEHSLFDYKPKILISNDKPLDINDVCSDLILPGAVTGRFLHLFIEEYNKIRHLPIDHQKLMTNCIIYSSNDIIKWLLENNTFNYNYTPMMIKAALSGNIMMLQLCKDKALIRTSEVMKMSILDNIAGFFNFIYLFNINDDDKKCLHVVITFCLRRAAELGALDIIRWLCEKSLVQMTPKIYISMYTVAVENKLNIIIDWCKLMCPEIVV